MTELLWEQVGEKILDLLKKYKDYELILAGHSLGAGAANLLNVLLSQERGRRINGRSVRCFSYASPPVFAPLDAVPEAALKSSVNFIHELDDVPFLAGYSVRHLLSCIAVLDREIKNLNPISRGMMARGLLKPSKATSQAVLQLDPLPETEGVPVLLIPAMASVWIRQKQTNLKYDAKLCDSQLLGRDAIYLYPDRFLDHLPARYEYALCNMEHAS